MAIASDRRLPLATLARSRLRVRIEGPQRYCKLIPGGHFPSIRSQAVQYTRVEESWGVILYGIDLSDSASRTGIQRDGRSWMVGMV